jgi:hypothetical protein
MKVSGQLHAQAPLPWRKSPQYPTDRRLNWASELVQINKVINTETLVLTKKPNSIIFWCWKITSPVKKQFLEKHFIESITPRERKEGRKAKPKVQCTAKERRRQWYQVVRYVRGCRDQFQGVSHESKFL